ncbi:MAG: hypothetical protein JSS24_13125 [Proteobacteria bacterium]|nr:hypothetical protein [Pseudomonadota bacterium]
MVFPRNSVRLADAVHQAGGLAELKMYRGVDHTAILAALSVPGRKRAPVLADVVHFIETRAERCACAAADNRRCSAAAAAAVRWPR